MNNEKYASGRIVCAGEVMIELAAQPDSSHNFLQGFAGDTYNTAVYLARAGLPVDYLTRLGDDAWSGGIIDQLAQEYIGTEFIARQAGAQPGLYLISNDANGERQFSYWRNSSAARQLFDTLPACGNPGLFYFSGITLAVCRSGLANLIQLLKTLRASGCRIVFDPNYRAALWDSVTQAQQHYQAVLPLCDMALPTLEDELALWGLATAEDCHAHYKDLGIDELVVKGSSLTTQVFIAQEDWQKQATALAAVDTTGAGDAFNAGYLAARCNGKGVMDAIEAAQQLAALVVMHRGAVLPPAHNGS